jgi:NAD(P)-dependent dehydrogenase (short-subunit alcohol dehydrogenase family)
VRWVSSTPLANPYPMSLRGQVAIVAGASGGIGSVTARVFADAGVHLVLAAPEDDALFKVASDAQRRGVRALAVHTDLRRRNDIDALVAAAAQEFGRIDILANIAGIGSSPSLCDSTDEELERVVSVNLLGAARLIHAVLPIMKAQRHGSIVNVGSIAGAVGVMGMYSGSKFGLRGLTDSVRREVRAYNISVTLVQPGFVRTPMNAAMGDGLPGPEVVAKAILDAVRRPRRERIVPFSYWLPVHVAKLFPGLIDLVFGDPRIQARLNRDARAARNGSPGSGGSAD